MIWQVVSTRKNMTASVELYTSSLENTSADFVDLYEDYVDEIESASPVDVISIIICVLGIAANSVSIVLVTRVSRKLTTHLKLITSLCVSDAFILEVTLLRTIYILTQPLNLCFNVAVRLAIDMALLATLFNLLAIAVDHYLAIIKPVMYRNGMTSARANCFVLGIWIISALGITIEVVNGAMNRYKNEDLCAAIAFDEFNVEVGVVVVIFVVLCVICLIFGRLSIYLRKSASNKSTDDQSDSRSPQALVTTSIFVGTFILFWLPIGIFNVYIYIQRRSITFEYIGIGEILFVLLLLNTIADPIIYTFRLPTVHKKCLSSLGPT